MGRARANRRRMPTPASATRDLGCTPRQMTTWQICPRVRNTVCSRPWGQSAANHVWRPRSSGCGCHTPLNAESAPPACLPLRLGDEASAAPPCEVTGAPSAAAARTPSRYQMPADRERTLWFNGVLRLLYDTPPLHAVAAALCLWDNGVRSFAEAAHVLPAPRAVLPGAARRYAQYHAPRRI